MPEPCVSASRQSDFVVAVWHTAARAEAVFCPFKGTARHERRHTMPDDGLTMNR
jgi:hypothetical protein